MALTPQNKTTRSKLRVMKVDKGVIKMTISARERFLNICRFESSGDLCLLNNLNHIHEEALEKWIHQGAPEKIKDDEFRCNYFQFTPIRTLFEIQSGLGDPRQMKINIGNGIKVRSGYTPLCPRFKSRIIEEDERTVTYFNGSGQTAKVVKGRSYAMPMFIDFPVKDRASWRELKKRLDPDTPERWPSDWDTYVKEMNNRPEPLVLDVGGFFGFLREWVGLENLLFMFYDEPTLIEEMMEQILYLESSIIKKTLTNIKIQQANFWEDMCYKAGPLISPTMVRRFMLPKYKRITDLLNRYGVDVVFLDSDGNINELIPIWLEGGINFLWPLEVAAGNDAIAIRKKYGKNLIMGGAIDKRALYKTKDVIRDEVMSKVPFFLETGGYFLSLDHSVPPEVPWENFIYFVNTVREVAGLEKLPT
jgi:uroporphyrinogen-III decarboxylase